MCDPDAPMSELIVPSSPGDVTKHALSRTPIAVVSIPSPESSSLPIALLLFSLSLKLLLFPAHFSTDFEVHRHWKALTHTLPLSQWYVDTSSKWTLDYPPLFAYFEYVQSCIAAFFHPPLVDLDNHNYATKPVVSFMRSSVLVPEVLLFISTKLLVSSVATEKARHKGGLAKAVGLVLLAPGLTLVDNIHFQYNSLPIAVLMLSLAFFYSGRLSSGAIAFVAALNIKHTLLPTAPVVAIYILAAIHKTSPKASDCVIRLFTIALATILTLTALWAPLYFAGGTDLLAQVMSRLFPFDRGLLHAYWAPNFWALYATADKLLVSFGLSLRTVDVDPTTGHIGGRTPFAVLWNPTPMICATALLASLIPALLHLSRRPDQLLLATAHATLAAFSIGWHVHEKAVLVPLLPLAALAGITDNTAVKEAFLWLSLGGQFALFPLVQEKGESMFKIAHFIAYHVSAMQTLMTDKWSLRHSMLSLYAAGTILLELYAGFGGVHRALFGERLQFLPLLLVSVYGAIGVLVAFFMITLLTYGMADGRNASSN